MTDQVATPVGRPVINVLVTEFTTFEVVVDPAAPEWRWLLQYPDNEWPGLLRQSASETDGQLAQACGSATGAWREVNLDAVIL